MTDKIYMEFKKPDWASSMESLEISQSVLDFLEKLKGKKVRFAFLAMVHSEPDADVLESSVGMVGIYRVSELFQLSENIGDYLKLSVKEALKELRK